MKALTKEQEQLLRELLKLTGGDVDLLREALERTQSPDGSSPLQDVVDYIVDYRKGQVPA